MARMVVLEEMARMLKTGKMGKMEEMGATEEIAIGDVEAMEETVEIAIDLLHKPGALVVVLP